MNWLGISVVETFIAFNLSLSTRSSNVFKTCPQVINLRQSHLVIPSDLPFIFAPSHRSRRVAAYHTRADKFGNIAFVFFLLFIAAESIFQLKKIPVRRFSFAWSELIYRLSSFISSPLFHLSTSRRRCLLRLQLFSMIGTFSRPSSVRLFLFCLRLFPSFLLEREREIVGASFTAARPPLSSFDAFSRNSWISNEVPSFFF